MYRCTIQYSPAIICKDKRTGRCIHYYLSIFLAPHLHRSGSELLQATDDEMVEAESFEECHRESTSQRIAGERHHRRALRQRLVR